MANKLNTPVFSSGAISRYLARPLDNYDFMKEAPAKELYANAKSLGMRFVTDNWVHQLACWNIAANLNSFLFYLKMSGGKSKIIIDQLRYRKKRGELARAIIMVPELMHIHSWEEQFKTHGPDLQYRLLTGNTEDRYQQLNKPADVYVLNSAGLLPFMTKRVVGKKKSHQVIDDEMSAAFAGQFNFVAFDELHRLTDPDSVYYGAYHWLGAAADYRYGLSGSAHGRDPTPLFSQFQLIDQGLTFGNNLALFRAAFFKPKYNHFKQVDWSFNQDRVPELSRMIKNRSIVYEVTEYVDMPKKMPSIRIPVKLSGEGKAYYERILSGVAEAKGDYESMKSIFTRMRQCTSGFLSLKADDESKIEVQFTSNPKMDALHEFLISRPNEKILVFHEYTHSGRLIEAMLDQAGIGYSSLRGSTRDPGGEYQRFLTDRKKRVFVLNNQVGSEAINPQYVCRRAIYYESPSDSKRLEQGEMRVWRNGQKHTVFIHDIVVVGTIDEKVLRYAKEGRDLLKAVMSGDASLLPET